MTGKALLTAPLTALLTAPRRVRSTDERGARMPDTLAGLVQALADITCGSRDNSTPWNGERYVCDKRGNTGG